MPSALEPAAPGARAAGRPRDRPRPRAGASVLGLGTALPEHAIANDRVARAIGVDDRWIVRRTGIVSRRYAAPEATLAGLAERAGRAALADAGLAASELDVLIVATFTPDACIPPASAQVAHALGAERAATFDLNNACSGFVSALAAADALLASGERRAALVIGAEIISRRLDPHDRMTAAVFGDGAGAVALGSSPQSAFGPFVLGADGSRAGLITTAPHDGTLRMDGPETFKQAVARLERIAREACETAGVDLPELDLLVFHQANARITRALGERLDVEPARVVDCIATLGNTSAASIPLALEHARRERLLHDGTRKVLLAAVGAGLAWGASVLDWGVR